MSQPEVLTRGQWEALLLQAPGQVRGFVLKLGIHHGVFEKPKPNQCPICGKPAQQAEPVAPEAA